VKRLRLPIDWLVFSAIMGWIYGLTVLAYGLYVWYTAWDAGNPTAFAEVPKGVWIGGLSALALAPGLALLAAIVGVQWVRIQGGCDDPRLFARFPLAESRPRLSYFGGLYPPTDPRGMPLDERRPFREWKLILACVLAFPPVGKALLWFLDQNPLGTVKVFGAEEGRLEMIIVAFGILYLLGAVIAAVRRVNRLQ